jgi:dTDP-4-amino-4,6-dideoxygalactose transaminase
VHLYGMPARMVEIMEIARRFGIPVIEDAAEALGSTYAGIPCGSLGDIGILSFNGNKIITTSGGGAMLSNNAHHCAKALFLATQARDKAPHYQHSEIGYNYRMSNICAGIGRGQMEALPQRVEKRRANFLFYKEMLNDLKGITVHQEPDSQFFSNHWLTTIMIDPLLTGGITCEDVRLKLSDMGIETRPIWKPMHMQPVFASESAYLNGVSEQLFKNGLCLPSSSSLTNETLDFIAGALIRTISGKN